MKKKSMVFVVLALLTTGILAGCSGKTPTHEHTYSDTWSSDATDHWHDPTCDDTTEVKDKAAHTFGEWSVVTAATCDAEGSESRSCTVCGYTETRTTDKTDHVFPDEWTYKDEDTHVRVCTNCGKEITQSHTWDEGTLIQEATCTQEGKVQYTCTKCGGTKIVITGGGEHDLHYISDAEGHWEQCSHCDYRTEKEAHVYASEEYTHVADATPVHAGKETRTCTVCEYEDVKALERLPYDFTQYTTGKDTIDNVLGIGTWNITTDSDNTWCNNGYVDMGATSYQYKSWGDSGNAQVFAWYLPRVDFTYYSEFTMKAQAYFWSEGVSIALSQEDLNGDKSLSYNNAQAGGQIVAGMDGDSLKVCLVLGNETLTTTITDPEIISGNDSVKIYVSSGTGDSRLDTSEFTVYGEHQHIGSASSASGLSCLGSASTMTCIICGEEVTVVNDTLDFTKDTYGQCIYNITDNNDMSWMTTSATTATSISYKSYVNATFRWDMPRVNYTVYKNVSAVISGPTWSGGLKVAMSQDGLDSAEEIAANSNVSGTYSVVYDGANLVATVTIDGYTASATITDNDVISGQKSVSLYVIGGNGDTVFAFSGWTYTA